MLQDFDTKLDLEPGVRTGSEPVPSLKTVDESGMLLIDWDKQMRPPKDLGLIQKAEYAVLTEDSVSGSETSTLRRRQLARRREWFDTEQ